MHLEPALERNTFDQPAQPTPESQHISSIDMLRGFAVLGILPMNIQAFAMVQQIRWNPTFFGPLTGANFAIWLTSHLLADEKFITILSLLFGAGILMTATRAEATGQPSAARHYRRMGWLILIGLAHAYLIFSDDVLVCYGLCGMLVYPLRNLRPRTLLILGLLLFLSGSILWELEGFSLSLQHLMQWILGHFHPIDDWQQETAAYRGSWLAQLQMRVPAALSVQTASFLIPYGWRISGLMLAGMALMKGRVFEARLRNRQYQKMIGIALLVGLPLTALGTSLDFATNWSYWWSSYVGLPINPLAAPIVSVGWIGAVMLLSRNDKARPFTQRLAAVGRMALTNYLVQSLICMFLFYGNGLGLFGWLDRTSQLAIVVAIWIAQWSLSPVWLKHFYFGPAEWLWRSLTYLQFEPFKRQKIFAS